MKKAVTFRLREDLLSAARDSATREHRTLTNFVEIALRNRIGEGEPEVAAPRRPAPQLAEGSTGGE